MADDITVLEDFEVDGWYHGYNGYEPGRVRVTILESDLPEPYRSAVATAKLLVDFDRLVKEHLKLCAPEVNLP